MLKNIGCFLICLNERVARDRTIPFNSKFYVDAFFSKGLTLSQGDRAKTSVMYLVSHA